MSIGERIKKRRKKKGLTQGQLGKKINVSSQVVSNWERGYSGLDDEDVSALARALNTSTDYLLGHTDNPEPKIVTIEDELKELLDDPEFMIAYKNMPGSPEEAKEELIRFMKYLQYEEGKKNKK